MKSKRWLFWLLAVVLMPALVLAAMLTYEIKSPWFPRIGLPAFDHEKAKLLTPEKRAAYEQELFSELQMWNTGSRKYPKLEDIRKREQRWMEMAEDGFELAHITLSVLQPGAGRVFSLRGPMHRLEELAQQGDVGAMCLMPGLVGKATAAKNTDSYESSYKKWLEVGAAKAHPECMKAFGGRLLLGTDGYTQNTEVGLNLLFKARSAGYSHDLGALILHYKNKGLSDLRDIRRLYCWTSVEEDQIWQRNEPEKLVEKIHEEGELRKRPELVALSDELRGKRMSLGDCLKLGR
jgi:hypothetical protein